MARFSFYPERRANAVDFCDRGQHPTLNAYKYDGQTWCPEHPCPSGEVDKAPRGTCEVGRIHNAPDGVWWLPSYQKFACKRHMGILVREIIRRNEFGR